jgi:hypothetical protein
LLVFSSTNWLISIDDRYVFSGFSKRKLRQYATQNARLLLVQADIWLSSANEGYGKLGVVTARIVAGANDDLK